MTSATESRRHQRRHETAANAVHTAEQCGISLREFIRVALPKLTTDQLKGIQRVIDGILTTRRVHFEN